MEIIKESVFVVVVVVVSVQRIAALTGKPITWESVSAPRRRIRHVRQRHCGPDPPTTYTDLEPITSPAQKNGHTISSEAANQKAQTKDPALTLPLRLHVQLKNHDPDELSTCSDLESGVADLSSRSSSGGDDRKDPDSDEAAFTTAWLQTGNPAARLGGERETHHSYKRLLKYLFKHVERRQNVTG